MYLPFDFPNHRAASSIDEGAWPRSMQGLPGLPSEEAEEAEWKPAVLSYFSLC